MTAVKGHLTAVEFPPDFKQWEYPPPDRLFDAPVRTVIPTVGDVALPFHKPRPTSLTRHRTTSILLRTSKTRQDVSVPWLSGQIAIEKASISVARSGTRRERATAKSKSNGPGLATSSEHTFCLPPDGWLPLTTSRLMPSPRASNST